ncbi:type II toxin-antitoxin system VapC family toxin [Methanoculleus sp.]|jgi:toxin FitB|uniref:type II toxin-antitoxin system VapC family toxin n=1 Tax=Methanoculleus sp. TaxID=90427 RepID=UPI002CEB9597|nr:type II toxin-antitoxin system VapC family toxin [Methanoculleus sp.]HNT08462.1 type II toxin-antitoxin system VapC family toxin [Methanoculleus sp.]
MRRHLLDTNILIYYLADAIPSGSTNKIEDMLSSSFRISIITKIEFLGWKKHTPEGYAMAEDFIRPAEVYPLTDTIADCAIHLRRMYGVKLPDAVIAATAMVHDCALVTRNEHDFSEICSLEIVNPFSDEH